MKPPFAKTPYANGALQQAHQHWLAGKRAEEQQQWLAARGEFEAATRLVPDDSLYWMHLGLVWMRLGDYDEALTAARRAHELEPGSPVAAGMLKEVLLHFNRHGEAADLLAGLPASVPRDAAFLTDQARVLLLAQRWQETVLACLQALRIDMRNPEAQIRMGMALAKLNRQRDSALCLETALLVDTERKFRACALSLLLHLSSHAMEWSGLAPRTAELQQALREGREEDLRMVVSFSLLALDCPPDALLRTAQANARRDAGAARPLPAPPARRPGPLRIGYLSSDFQYHATMHLLAGLLEQHDRSRVEVVLYCHSPEDGSESQRRARAAADRFRDVRGVSDADVARLMREDGIDIAIDLKGQTGDSRYQILAWRPAPVQVSFLGFPGTLGTEFIDYIVGDPVVTPLEHAAHYSERIAQMPHSYQPNDSRRVQPPRPARADLGLPEDAVVFNCFNQPYKILPAMADLWAQILREAPNTVLWLLTWNEAAAINFTQEMQARGVAPERLFFSPKVSAEDNQARLQCADLFLDTWPCNAHTTASEALWGGVPVLTVPGQTFASRVAASLVTACGLPELACATPEDYVAQAVALARDPARLARLRRHLEQNRMQLPLFDTQRYARDFEALLERMWARHEAGLPPEALAAQGTA